MNTRIFDRNLNALRLFSQDVVPDTMFPIVRIKARSFGGVQPQANSEAYRDLAVETTMNLMERFHGLYAVTFNDEISIALPSNYTQFDRKVERLVSVFTSYAASSLTLDLDTAYELDEPVELETTVFAAPNADLAIDYFRWRQADCYRWSMKERVKQVLETTNPELDVEDNVSQMSYQDMTDFLTRIGIDYANTGPAWLKRGTGVYYVDYEKGAVGPDGVAVAVKRRQIFGNYQLPGKERYSKMLAKIIK